MNIQSLLRSSANAEKISLTIRSLTVLIISMGTTYLTFRGVNLDTPTTADKIVLFKEQVTLASEQITLIVSSIISAISAATAAYGAMRKVFYLFMDKKDTTTGM